MGVEKTEEEFCAEVRQAMKNHEFNVYYQPQYNAITNRLNSAEALVRWIKPDGTIVMPGEFIPRLEKSEMILELDWYMLRGVCAFLKKQKEEEVHSVPVAVNFSRMHIYEESFLEQLCEIVDGSGVSRKLIEVEVTESAFVDQSKQIAELIKAIREDGFRVAIDDFGSGLSSLSFVKDISVDVLKIDKSLLSRNCEDEKERIVLESIFNFAHRLKLTTVAEGVETREQLGFLRTCDCKLIQGFLFARPMPEEKFWEACINDVQTEEAEDILLVQAPSSATQLLLEAVFIRYPLVIFSNLTRNSFYMMAYDNFTSRSCPSTGVFDELIAHGASTMHPEDQDLFRNTFSISNQLAAYNRGDRFVSVVTRQMGDDGIYRRVETTNYFVKNPAVDDVLVISLCHNLD
ncbi:MAG: EAL domain-containing protein [Bacteroidales bacterium]|nr:EAL domain-containing protein [Clostridium sp.]MCM1203157.1 EAL domain-containing protein [Bacteroidales bacterium]